MPVRHVTEISRWNVTLKDGSVVEVWADGFEELEGFYSFGVLVDAEGEVPGDVLVTNRTPSNDARVVIAFARFPISSVSEISSA